MRRLDGTGDREVLVERRLVYRGDWGLVKGGNILSHLVTHSSLDQRLIGTVTFYDEVLFCLYHTCRDSYALNPSSHL